MINLKQLVKTKVKALEAAINNRKGKYYAELNDNGDTINLYLYYSKEVIYPSYLIAFPIEENHMIDLCEMEYFQGEILSEEKSQITLTRFSLDTIVKELFESIVQEEDDEDE